LPRLDFPFRVNELGVSYDTVCRTGDLNRTSSPVPAMLRIQGERWSWNPLSSCIPTDALSSRFSQVPG
jgi:hypothetical protein